MMHHRVGAGLLARPRFLEHLTLKRKIEYPSRKLSPRLKTHDYSEPYTYSFTICTADRLHIFNNNENSELVANTIKEDAKRYDTDVIAYCIMPDHIHLLLQPNGKLPVTRYVDLVKGKITRLLHRNGFSGKVWQRGYFEHILRRSEKPGNLVKYVLENPVRRGLVDSFHDFAWSWDKFGIKETAAGGKDQDTR